MIPRQCHQVTGKESNRTCGLDACLSAQVIIVYVFVDDLDIKYSRSSGPGGQNVNKGMHCRTLSAVRLITLMHCCVLNVMVFANNTELFTVILSS